MIVPRTTLIPLRSSRAPSKRLQRGPRSVTEGLLIVGHGSKCMISAAQMHEIGDMAAAAHPDRIVEVGFLEMTDPPAAQVLDEMIARGCRRIVVLPFMLLGASHAKSDVPAIVVEGRLRHPQVDLRFGSPLGVVPELVEIAADNLGAVDGTGVPLLVIARGTSDPDANGEATKAARLLGEWVDAGDLQVGFTGMTWPRTPAALDMMERLGHRRIAVFFWFLCNGKLIERARDEIAEFVERTGIDVVDAGYFGPDPRLVVVITRRYLEALDGVPVVNCDTCAYRAPFPGMEEKAGQAIGVGHSHHAAEHRHSHLSDDDQHVGHGH
ncbi:sirohydrochlorin chelatase [Ilumatobacter sp.]|uniref:sirohydrochlorin chelatase n=2 Tax=Ilumatobacter sp. TaxID=1967498 RepID=UPI003751F335